MENQNVGQVSVSVTKKHGWLLMTWLILMLIGNIISCLTYLLGTSAVANLYPNSPVWIFYIYGIVTLANVIFVVFLLKWKKWAFFAYCISTGIAFILNLMIGLGIVTAIWGLVGPVILYFILRSRWALLN